MPFDWHPLYLTFSLAFTATLLLLIIGLPLGYWLAFTKFPFKPVLETIISMPIVLPPTVLGFYFLLVFSPSGMIGGFLEQYVGIRLVFTFHGIVVASVIYSLPFMVHPLQAGFQNAPPSIREAAYTLGKSPLNTAIRVLLPNMKPALVTGVILSFAHTVGEFGVILMIGGSIPEETRVASIAIYTEVEALRYGNAHFYAAILFAITFAILLLVFILNKKLLRMK